MSIGDEQQDVPNSSEGQLAAESGPAKERTAKPKQSAKAHLFVTITHWAMVILLLLALLSGMRIGWGYTESPLGGEQGLWASFLNSIAPKGDLFGFNLIDLHVPLALFMIAVSAVYAIYMFRSRASKRLRVTGKDMEKLQKGLRAGNFWRNKAALWSANLIVYWVAFVFVIVLVGTGLAMYFLNSGLADFGPMEYVGGYSTVRLLHGLIAYLLIPYTILHSLLQWFFGRFWSIFKAQLYRPHMRAGAIGLVFGVIWFGWLYAWNEKPLSMTVARLPATVSPPVLDGIENEAAWEYVKSVPAQRAVLLRTPAKIQLWFNEPLESKYSSLSVTDEAGKSIALSGLEVGGDEPKRITANLSALPAGRYIVKYRVLSVDGHIVQDQFTFTIKQ